jgi:hypothetical protein
MMTKKNRGISSKIPAMNASSADDEMNASSGDDTAHKFHSLQK